MENNVKNANHTIKDAVEECAAIVVCYNPNPQDIVENIKSLLVEFTEVMIVDNHSLNFEEWGHKVIQCGAEVISLKDNYGIAKATNIGILNLKRRFTWIALFDQDSKIRPRYIEYMFYAYNKFSRKDDVAIIAPDFSLVKDDLEYKISEAEVIDTAIASGSLIKRSVLIDTGLLAEELFIDYVDTEFCLRVKKLGYLTIQIKGIQLNHSLGNMKEYTVLRTKLLSSNHSPVRRYYRSRNRVYVFKRYISVFPKWVLRDAIRAFTETAKILLLEDHKSAKLLAIYRGFLDALRGKWGRYE